MGGGQSGLSLDAALQTGGVGRGEASSANLAARFSRGSPAVSWLRPERVRSVRLARSPPKGGPPLPEVRAGRARARGMCRKKGFAMQQQISVITRVVADLYRSRRLHAEGFGWQPVFETGEIAFIG